MTNGPNPWDKVPLGDTPLFNWTRATFGFVRLEFPLLLAAVGELHFKPEDDAPDDRFTLRSFRLKEGRPRSG